MSSDNSSPPYILLNDRLPASYAFRLLGRIVADPLWPPDEYVPKTSTPVDLTDAVIEVADEDAELTLSANRGTAVAGRLGKVLGLSREVGREVSGSLTGKRVITRSLEQQRDVFEQVALRGPARDQVLEFLSRPDRKRRGFMVVGVKTVVDPTVELGAKETKTIAVDSELPVAEALNAAAVANTGIPALGLVPELVNPGGDVKWTSKHEWLKKHTAEGECVFAIRYRVVKLKGARVWPKREQQAEYGRVYRTEAGHGVFAGEDDENDEEAEDEDEDDVAFEAGNPDGNSTSLAILEDADLPPGLVAQHQIQQ